MPAERYRLRFRFAALTLAVALTAGCAVGTNPQDPFESFNRRVYSFNEGLDRAVLKPTARAYRAILPEFVRASVSNVFSNIDDVVVALNNLLQGKFTAAYSDLGRVAINSTIGILGLFDVASEAGIQKHDEDFGQTLGRWGVADGPFIMLPLLGPSSGRDVVGRVGDYFSDPVTYVDPSRAYNQLWGTRLVSRRAELLDAGEVLQTAALDPYEFLRDAYLQRRRNLIYDGAAPPDREFLDPLPRTHTPQLHPHPHAASIEIKPPGSDAASVSVDVIVPGRLADAPVVTPIAFSTSGRAATAPNHPPAPIAAARDDGSTLVTGEPLSAVELELLAPGQLSVAGAEKPAVFAPPRLTQFWKALQLQSP